MSERQLFGLTGSEMFAHLIDDARRLTIAGERECRGFFMRNATAMFATETTDADAAIARLAAEMPAGLWIGRVYCGRGIVFSRERPALPP